MLYGACSPYLSPILPAEGTAEEIPSEEEKPEEEEPQKPVDQDPVTDPLMWESAAQAVANMGVGWNLGNTLDAYDPKGGRGDDWRYWETYWGQYQTTPELMHMMKQAGFGVIRVPVTWGIHMDEDNKVYDAWMNRVHEIVDYVLDAGLYCIVNIHHDTGAGDGVWLLAGMDAYEQVKDKYVSLWTQIAEEFKDYGPRLLFESYNEMLDTRRSWCFASFNNGYDAAFAADAYKAINSYAQTFVDVVRATGGNNAERNLVVNTYGACSGSGTWNSHLKDPLKEMKLPEDKVEGHLIFEVHSYPGIDNMSSMRAEVDDMFSALDTHLASKGAPVILGEWGTSSEAPSQQNRLEFIDYFVTKAMEYNMGTIYWMGLSDGVARSFPYFNQPEEARAILKAYHGDGYNPVIPTINDFECTYSVTYTSQWGELHLSNRTINLDEYKGVYLLLESVPGEGELAVKIYGEEDGMTQYESVGSNEVTVHFDRSQTGDVSTRITLQYMQTGTYSVDVKKAALIKSDGSFVTADISPFWGCDMTMTIHPQ